MYIKTPLTLVVTGGKDDFPLSKEITEESHLRVSHSEKFTFANLGKKSAYHETRNIAL
jgi:hypothetical protein